MKVAISTLGCKVNQYETQAMEQELRRRGHEIVDFSDAADAYVVNSCSVTAVSDRKSRQQLYRIRREHPAAKMTQVPKAIKEERARRAIALGRELHEEYMEKCIGQVYPVLFEQPSGRHFSGHAPNYMEVLVDTKEDLHNRVLPVRITGTEGDALLGEIVE